MNELKLLMDYVSKENMFETETPFKKISTNRLYLKLLYNSEMETPEILLFLAPFHPSLSSRYKVIQKLKENLLNEIQNNINFKHHSIPNIAAKIKCYKNWTTANILLFHGKSNIAFILIKKTLATAIKYEFIELAFLSINMIIKLSGRYKAKPKEVIKYQKIQEKYNKLYEQSTLIDTWFTEIAMLYRISKGGNTDILLEKLNNYKQKMLKIQKENDSFEVNFQIYNILSTLYVLEKDYQATIDNANKAIEFISNKKNANKRHIRSFNNDLIISNTMLGNYSIIDDLVSQNKKMVKNGSMNYFNTLSYQFTSKILQEDYITSLEICLEAINHNTIMNNQYKLELWQIRIGFLFILYKIGVFNTSASEIINFRTRKLLNNSPIATRDKKGMQNSLKTLEILLLLIDKKNNNLIDMSDNLRVYYDTYLTGASNYRNRLFYTMIRTMILKSNFHPVRALQLASPKFKKLQSTKPNFVQVEQEVIPYEKLWKLIIQILENNRKKRKKT